MDNMELCLFFMCSHFFDGYLDNFSLYHLERLLFQTPYLYAVFENFTNLYLLVKFYKFY